ncbi:hypothetical protein C2G38_2179302 [Gigaspora rosea]|uniref:Uncharacterized protein n=1 Tax=Gigaspora rosea TaxID=44941 RepID=A0A397VHI0_9GLOM|nr:hypothetical protein C2G38_2179302 [Gigaspora rosea]
MPCYLETIVKIKHVKQNETKDSKSIQSVKRDPESQAIFRRREYYSVRRKIVPSQYAGDTRPKMSVVTSTHMTITNNASESNKCPLKVLFVDTLQGKLTVIKNTENSIIEMLITDYISQDYSYTINVVIPHTNPRFEHIKTATHLQESIVFVVGQMEMIDNQFYVNTKDINYIVKNKNSDIKHSQILTTPINSTHSKLLNIYQQLLIYKNQSFLWLHSQILTTPINSTHSKLLNIYQNIYKNLKSMPSTDSSNIKCEPSSKCQKLKETDESIENPSEMENAETIDVEFTNATRSETKEANFIKSKKLSKNNKSQKYNTQNPVRTTCGAKPSHELNQDTVDSDKE